MSITITSTALGHTLTATSAYSPGDTVLTLIGAESTTKDKYSIQIGSDLHLNPLPDATFEQQMMACPWIVANHSCDPNVNIVDRQFIAIKEIRAGDAITFDYETTEVEMAEPFQCGCGAASCRGRIQGYRFLNETDR